MPKLKSSTAATALVGIWTVTLAAFILSALYFARDLLVPLTLAALLTFLLAPLVTRLERWLGRIVAVLLVISLIFAGAGAGGWILTRQLIDLATKLPDYKENIQTKLRSFKVAKSGRFARFWATVDELKSDLPGGKDRANTKTAETIDTPGRADVGASKVTDGIKEAAVKPPVTRSSVETFSRDPFQIVRGIVAPLLGPLGTAALVVLLVIFMLLKREDLRSRLIRLMGQGRISATTRAMDDAGSRVRRYLVMLLVLNVTYGIAVTIGLYFIGVPNAILWGACAAVLRFIPYVGPSIGAAIPIALSLAVSNGWLMPSLTVGLFVVIELLSNNVMEPWLYGSRTGVSPIALIFAAACWTWLWGPVGLVLSTPLTVCLMVIGRHIPRLSFLSVVLSNEEALTPAQDCYHRLLTVGENDEMELIEAYLKANSLTALYDSMLIPVISAIEIDHRQELLDDEQHALVQQSLRDIVEDLGARPPVASKIEIDTDIAGAPYPPPAPVRVCCLPARAERDELAGTMLVQLLLQQGFEARCAPANVDAGELIRLVAAAEADVACISVVAPSTVLHARYLCLKLRALLPKQKIMVGLWGTENIADATRRVREAGADEVATTFAEAVLQLEKMARPHIEQAAQTPIRVNGEVAAGL